MWMPVIWAISMQRGRFSCAAEASPAGAVFTNKELQGGGPLIDLGVHALDTVLHIMGYPVPKTVMGATYSEIGKRKGVGLLGEWDWHNYSVEDFARGMILFEDGRSIILETSFALNMEARETLQLSFLGNTGGADLFPIHTAQPFRYAAESIHRTARRACRHSSAVSA